MLVMFPSMCEWRGVLIDGGNMWSAASVCVWMEQTEGMIRLQSGLPYLTETAGSTQQLASRQQLHTFCIFSKTNYIKGCVIGRKQEENAGRLTKVLKDTISIASYSGFLWAPAAKISVLKIFLFFNMSCQSVWPFHLIIWSLCSCMWNLSVWSSSFPGKIAMCCCCVGTLVLEKVLLEAHTRAGDSPPGCTVLPAEYSVPAA